MAEPTSVLSWSAQEFEKKERHRDWHWYVGLVFGIGAVFSFFYGNIFFGIFLIIAGAVVIIYAFREPKTLTITLTDKEVRVNEEIIPYDRITQFWLDETDKPDKLVLRVKGSFVPLVSIPLDGVSAESVRAVLKDTVKEEEIPPSNSARIFDRMGF